MTRLQWLSAILLGFAVIGFVATNGGAAMQTSNPTPASGGPGTCGPWGSGMMGDNQHAGHGMMGDDRGDWANCAWDGMGPGMMGPGMMGGMMSGMMGPGMMGGMMSGMMGPGMVGGMMGFYPATATPISEADAEQRLQSAAASIGPEVKVGEVIPFASNYYAELTDANGAGLAEVLVDRYSGAVYPEHGPNMMWNTGWGMMVGVGAATQYDEAAAQGLAETFLAGYLPGATVLEGTAFPGYYTFDYGRDQIEGMLSVNAATGEIWVHTWHGPALTDQAP